jgi:hypothetical protein
MISGFVGKKKIKLQLQKDTSPFLCPFIHALEHTDQTKEKKKSISKIQIQQSTFKLSKKKQ